ncbi:MAG: carbohydrate porin [Candidatus Omnitrophota bacterium]|nr:carbohydrate porin [Candidatus Omnitrophota bacterium]
MKNKILNFNFIFFLFCFFLLIFIAAPARSENTSPRISEKSLIDPSTASPWFVPEAPEVMEQKYMTGNWAGMRDKLADSGITFLSTYVFDVLGNPVGGEKQGTEYDHSMGLDVNLDLEKAAGVKGLQLHASCLWRAGANLSTKYIGNAFTASSIFGSEEFKFYSLYLEQSFFDDQFNIRFGRFSPGDEFAASPIYWIFVNNSIDGNPISLPRNLPFLTYPNATWGARAILNLTDTVYSKTAIFNGDPRVGRDSAHGFDFGLRLNRGLIYLQEFGYTPNKKKDSPGMPGNYKIGGFYHSGKFFDLYSDPNGGSYIVTGLPRKKRIGNWGFYTHTDQMLYREGGPGSDQGLTAFVVFTWAPANFNQFPFFMDCGLLYKGLIPGRDEDTAAVGFTYGMWSRELARSQRDDREINRNTVDPQEYEIMLDFTYKLQITKWFFVQPDIQYIIHPGGTGKVPNAMVIGSRFGFTF